MSASVTSLAPSSGVQWPQQLRTVKLASESDSSERAGGGRGGGAVLVAGHQDARALDTVRVRRLRVRQRLTGLRIGFRVLAERCPPGRTRRSRDGWPWCGRSPALNHGLRDRPHAARATGFGARSQGLPRRIRRIFADVRVREALGMMFDFEWINANLYGGLYRRSKSFFDDSDLASTSRPADAGERALLAAFPGAVRDDILEGRWEPPVSDGSGRDRTMAQRALALLGKAGYAIKDGVLVERTSGRPFAFEILVQSNPQERLSQFYAESLRRIGIYATVRLVDEVQYERRRQKFDFDMLIAAWIATSSPGYEQRFLWGSQSADQEASYNLAGARSPAIDAMIAAMVAAKTRGNSTMP